MGPLRRLLSICYMIMMLLTAIYNYENGNLVLMGLCLFMAGVDCMLAIS